ncbi:hypothetical protein A2U01_0022199, partial [Trifolium medium]|nr:hypothetical protein [Trifolium medium]
MLPSPNDVRPISDETFPSMEPIDASDLLTVVLQVSKDIPPSTEQIEEQSFANDSVEGSKLMVEIVTPMCEIISNPLVRMLRLNHAASYAFSDASHQCNIRFDYTPSLELPLVDLKSLKAVMVHLPNPLIIKSSNVFDPPLPKPQDLTQIPITNPAPPPEPPDNVTLSTLIALMTE